MQDAPSLAPLGCMKCGKNGPLRRKLCAACYESWVLAKPVGLGATCLGCGERRLLTLRFYEIQRGFVVLCNNCSVRARALAPQPRTADALQWRLRRDRRSTWDRRGPGSSPQQGPTQGERRQAQDRRVGARDLYDATDLLEEVPEREEGCAAAIFQGGGPGVPVGATGREDDLTRIRHRP